MFKVILDVQQFQPDEINVKLVDRFVIVEAKHEEKRDVHGLISRQFVTKYLLPEQVDENQLSSNISSDGILTIMAPVKTKKEEPNERTVKIEMTGKPAIRDTVGTTTTITAGMPEKITNPVQTTQEQKKPEE
ncbi:Protein lethal(2)essential for life [Dufourea novaeangliae]|uniref:Protein lethal(2)essential for life n=3 Tax=Dufourea novaeangliae TaxID=178035 RepID=A0A154PDN1_DUFNO|nr:Protein lethal(2)essential for life [Dufourea novaeangliae]